MNVRNENSDKVNDYKKLHIEEYSFQVLSGPQNQFTNSNIKAFEFNPLTKAANEEKLKLSKIIKAEAQFAKSSSFQISPIVKEFRGMREQEEKEFDARVAQKVELELSKIKDDAIYEGIEMGKSIGIEQMKIESQSIILEKTRILESVIQSVAQNKINIIKDQENKIIELFSVIAKWIILRELKEDGAYLTRLMQKLMGELNQRDHLVVKINKNYFTQMEDVVSTLREKFNILQNCRVEVDHFQENVGMILESVSGLVNGSFEVQMKFLDSLFEKVLET